MEEIKGCQNRSKSVNHFRVFPKLKMYKALNNPGDMNGKGWNTKECLILSIFCKRGDSVIDTKQRVMSQMDLLGDRGFW